MSVVPTLVQLATRPAFAPLPILITPKVPPAAPPAAVRAAAVMIAPSSKPTPPVVAAPVQAVATYNLIARIMLEAGIIMVVAGFEGL